MARVTGFQTHPDCFVTSVTSFLTRYLCQDYKKYETQSLSHSEENYKPTPYLFLLYQENGSKNCG